MTEVRITPEGHTIVEFCLDHLHLATLERLLVAAKQEQYLVKMADLPTTDHDDLARKIQVITATIARQRLDYGLAPLTFPAPDPLTGEERS